MPGCVVAVGTGVVPGCTGGTTPACVGTVGVDAPVLFVPGVGTASDTDVPRITTGDSVCCGEDMACLFCVKRGQRSTPVSIIRAMTINPPNKTIMLRRSGLCWCAIIDVASGVTGG